MNVAGKHQPDIIERPASLLVPTWVSKAPSSHSSQSLITALMAKLSRADEQRCAISKGLIFLNRLPNLNALTVTEHASSFRALVSWMWSSACIMLFSVHFQATSLFISILSELWITNSRLMLPAVEYKILQKNVMLPTFVSASRIIC